MPTQNIEGNIIAADFNHGRDPTGPRPARSTTSRSLPPWPVQPIAPERRAHPGQGRRQRRRRRRRSRRLDPDRRRAHPGHRPRRQHRASSTRPVTPATTTSSRPAGPRGYTASGWDCDGGTLDGTTLTLADGDDVICTITNDDETRPTTGQAELTLVKVVVNDDGGAAEPGDWTLTADGPTQVTGPATAPSIIDQTRRLRRLRPRETGGPRRLHRQRLDCDARHPRRRHPDPRRRRRRHLHHHQRRQPTTAVAFTL